MNLPEFDDYVAYSRLHFEEGLIRSGFSKTDQGWRGAIAHSGGTTEVLLKLTPRFPFRPPHVVPVEQDAVPWSWHRELDGALCLVAEDDHDDLWWTEAPALLEHVTAWLEQASAGWPDDRGDLDLDRYFHVSQDKALYLYDELAQYRNAFVRFRPAKNNVMRIGRGTRPVKPTKHRRDRFGYVADVGDVDVPPRTWDDIAYRIEGAKDLDSKIRQHKITVVVLMYRRGGHDGAIVLEVWPTSGGNVEARRLRSGGDTKAARTTRAGALAPELAECHVAVVGVGALGSFIADMLVRSGRTFRIDVIPPLDGAPNLPPSADEVIKHRPEVFEAGCGSPVSPTPPHAVIEAAAATVRHSIGLLVKRPLHPAGEIRFLQPVLARSQQ